MVMDVPLHAAPASTASPRPPGPGQYLTWPDELDRWLAKTLGAGQEWDAVRLDEPLAGKVFALMYRQTGGDTGPVVMDDNTRQHYWLIRAGYLGNWTFPGVRRLTAGSWVVMPPTERRAWGVRWLMSPCADGHLVHAPLLHSTVMGAIAA